MVAEGDSGVGGGITVHVRPPNGSIFFVQTTLGTTTVGEFKVLVAQNSDVSAHQQRLIYRGQILNDDRTLESYGLQADHTVHMVRRLPAVSTNTTGAANHGDSDTGAYIRIYQGMLQRSGYLAVIGFGPRPSFPTSSTIISRNEIDELREMIQIRQVQLEMDQVQFQDDLNLGQLNQLEWELHSIHQRQQRLIEVELRLISGIRQFLDCYESQRQVEDLVNGPHRGNISDSSPSSNAPARD